MKTVQIPRGPTTQESTVIGAEGQLRFDTSRGTLRAHDGVTRGGHELPNIELVRTLIASGGATAASGVIQYYGTEAELSDAVPSANALAVVNESGLEEIYTWKAGANDGGGISSNIDGYWRRTDSSVGFYVRLWRAAIINMQINGSQPSVDEDTTLWLTNGVAKIYDGANYETATPALFARLMAMVGGYAIGAVSLPDRLLDTLIEAADADAITDAGWYKSATLDVNVPSSTVSVIEHRKISANEMMQTFYTQASATFNVYRRFKTGGVWGSWTQLLSLIPDRLGATASTVTNANSALDSGFYRMVSGGTNMPVAANGVLFVSRYSSTEAAQTFVRTSDGYTWTRGYAASAFSAWVAVAPMNLANLETVIAAMSGKVTLVDADVGVLGDSTGTAGAGTYGKSFTMANLATYIGSKFGSMIAALTAKTTVIDADSMVIVDSAAANAPKEVTMTELWTNYLKVKADALYAALVHTHTIANVTNLQTSLDAKAALASPALTGTPTAPTAAPGTNTTQIATTAHVKAADDLKANLASPALTGTPTAPTAAAATNTTQVATTAFATTADNLKANLASPALTGNPTAPTQAAGNNSTRLATTAYVDTKSGLEYYSTQQPTSDVAEVIFTGLDGCRVVELSYVFLNNSTNAPSIQGRVSGGTWRALTSISNLAGNYIVAGRFTVYGFNANQDMKMMIGNTAYTTSSAMDASDAANILSLSYTGSNVHAAAPSWNEVWDEIKIVASIEGSTADDRGWFTCIGYK